MNQLPIYILAGGRSSRFGSDKTRAQLGGIPLIAQLVRLLAPVATGVTLIADRADRYADLGLRGIADLRPGLGPLGGLETALLDAGPGAWCGLIAGDWAGVRPEWLSLLMEHRRADARFVLFGRPRPEPLFALYHASLLGTVAAQLDAGRLAMRDLIASVPGVVLPVPAAWAEVVNINRQTDLERFIHGKGAAQCVTSAVKS